MMSSPAQVESTPTVLPGSTPIITSASSTHRLTRPGITASVSEPTAAPYPPITTHWSRPSNCTWTYIVDYDLPPTTDGPVAWLDLEPIPGASTLSCYPDGMFEDNRTGVFSPATCPNGWTTVTNFVNTGQSSDEKTTTALCCSSEYTLDGSYCKREVPTVLAVPITYNHTASTYEIMTNTTTTLYSATLAVNTIRALFRDSDQAILGITGDEDIDDDPEPWHLSIPAKIGIGVGVTVFGLLTVLALFFLFQRSRHSKRNRLKGRTHEMDSMRGSGRPLSEIGWSSCHEPQSHGQTRHGLPAHDAGPPHDPEQEVGIDSRSLGESMESGNEATQDEITVLMAQKAAIQRRIEELERGEKEESKISKPQ